MVAWMEPVAIWRKEQNEAYLYSAIISTFKSTRRVTWHIWF